MFDRWFETVERSARIPSLARPTAIMALITLIGAASILAVVGIVVTADGSAPEVGVPLLLVAAGIVSFTLVGYESGPSDRLFYAIQATFVIASVVAGAARLAWLTGLFAAVVTWTPFAFHMRREHKARP